ncbi:MAG TPA: hypothetical protein PLD59_03945 [Tepidisphaeraceae bacterium]|nr:hypothetical protein [Tepidisphaeraceae bacterium]
MRIENMNNDEESESDGSSALTDVLSSNEAEFVVTEEPRSLNKSTLVLILLVVLGGGGLYLMHLRSGPKAVAAAETQEAAKTISSFLSGGDSNIKLMEKALRDTEAVVRRFANYPNTTQVPLNELQTNPFHVWVVEEEQPQTDVISKRRKEEERQAVIKAVQGLQLQSIMSGSAQKACMINNTLFREGQSVDGFTVEKISASSVVVRQGQYRFELRMQR